MLNEIDSTGSVTSYHTGSNNVNSGVGGRKAQGQGQVQNNKESEKNIDVSDMEKFIFIYAEKFFQQYGDYNFAESKRLFDRFKLKFMEEKLNIHHGDKTSVADDIFKR
ncbi:unnamed protein product [Ambrosiozyma monospora]|uniref:Unnamed protein product n=1 Tax=Ambrosiozyma monospora TaxID=43982 RepID=A0ACB5TAN7_AMBMO|nr:unnamed protein product [Ambrosiozyma monospora]